MDELNSRSLGNNVQVLAQFLYGYGFWGRYSEINENLKLGKVTCDYEELDLVIEEYYQVFIKDCDKLDSTMAEVIANELNRKIKKNLHCLISHSLGNRAINDLVYEIDMFTDVLSENCGAETTESRNAVVPVEETKIAEDVTEPPTPVATKDSEEPTNSSDAMETDAPAPEQESSNNAAA